MKKSIRGEKRATSPSPFEEQAKELDELRHKFPSVELPTGGVMTTPIPTSEFMKKDEKKDTDSIKEQL